MRGSGCTRLKPTNILRDTERVSGALRGWPGGGSTAELAKALGRPREAIYDACRKLEREGKVIQRGVCPHNRGNSALWWRIKA